MLYPKYDLDGVGSSEERIFAQIIKGSFLFEYFEELNSGQTGYGVSYIDWLKVSKGIIHHGSGKFQKTGKNYIDETPE